MDTTDMTPEQINELNEKYDNMAAAYVKNYKEPPLPPEVQAEFDRKIERHKRPRQSDSENSDENTDINPTNKKPKANTSIDKWTKYYIIESVAKEGATLDKLSPFAVNKYITNYVGEVASVNKLRSGSLLVEASTKKQSEKIQNLTHFNQIRLQVSPHNSLNSKKGVIRCADFKGMTEDDLQEELKYQGVTHVNRIKITKNGKKENTNTFILTFDTHELPKTIKAGYLRLAVSQYIPNPLRCFKCQKFGHHKDKCRSKMTCQICSEEGHDSRDCGKDPKCVNCEGKHTSNSKDCPAWKKQKNIIKIKIEKNISFPEARRLCEAGNVAGPVTYAQAVAATSLASKSTVSPKPTSKSIHTQTNITWPQNSENHKYYTAEIETQTETPQPSSSTKPPSLPTKTQHLPDKTQTPQNRSQPPQTKAPPPKTQPQTQNQYKPGPASSKFKRQSDRKHPKKTIKEGEVEIELHNRYSSLSEDEEDHMDTGPCDETPTKHSSSEENG